MTKTLAALMGRLAAIAVLSGCDAILSHPAVPHQASQLAREGIAELQSMRSEVGRLMLDLHLSPPERAAVAQMTKAMFLVLEAPDAGSLVKAAVEIKRAQLCLLKVGLQTSGILEDVRGVVFKESWALERWKIVEEYLAGVNSSKLNDLICEE